MSEVNWLKIGGVVRVSELDHQFFFYIDLVQILQKSKNTPSVITVLQDHTALLSRIYDITRCNM